MSALKKTLVPPLGVSGPPPPPRSPLARSPLGRSPLGRRRMPSPKPSASSPPGGNGWVLRRQVAGILSYGSGFT